MMTGHASTTDFQEGSLRTRLQAAFAALSPSNPDAVAALGPLYDDDIHFEDPMQIVDGRDAFLAVNRRLLARSRELSFEVLSTMGGDAEFAMTWKMRLLPKVGPLVTLDGITHARTRGGKVFYHRDYWDMASLLASAVPRGREILRFTLKPFA